MARSNIKRQNELEPERVVYAKVEIEALGIEVDFIGSNRIEFKYLNETITFFPYSGWHTGKSIKDGRGIKKLLRQIKP